MGTGIIGSVECALDVESSPRQSLFRRRARDIQRESTAIDKLIILKMTGVCRSKDSSWRCAAGPASEAMPEENPR